MTYILLAALCGMIVVVVYLLDKIDKLRDLNEYLNAQVQNREENIKKLCERRESR